MSGQAGQEGQKRRRGQVEGGRSVPEQDADDLATEHDRDPGDRQHHEEDQPDRPRHQGRELVEVGECRLPRQRRQDDDAERHADHTDRDLEQGECDVEHADRARAERGRDRVEHDERDLTRSETECARGHQLQRPARLGIVELDPPVVSVALGLQRGDLDEQMAEGAGNDADGQTGDPERGGEDEGRADDREVVDDRRDGRGRESTPRVEHARGQRAEREEDRAQNHDPGQADRPVDLLRSEPRIDGPDDRRCGDEDDQSENEQPDQHHVRDRRDDPPGPRGLIGREQGRHDRDHGRRQRARRDELEHQVGQPERGEERIEVRTRRERVRDDDDPEPAEDARDEEGARDDQTGSGEGARRAHEGTGWRFARGWAPRYADRSRAGETWV